MNLMSLLKKKAPVEPKPKEKKKEVKKPEAPAEVDLGWVKGVHYFD